MSSHERRFFYSVRAPQTRIPEMCHRRRFLRFLAAAIPYAPATPVARAAPTTKTTTPTRRTSLLIDPDRSPLYVFFDDNQRIFAVPENLPVPGEPIQLTVNCRNTKTINRLVNSFYRGATIEASGPEGIPIDKHFYATDRELLDMLDATVERWLGEASVEPEDIALLTPKASHRSALWQVNKLGGARLTDDPWERGRILRSSIHRFKGLERLVVGVAELDGARDDVFYVGFSRPNVFLSIFCPESARKRLPRALLS